LEATLGITSADVDAKAKDPRSPNAFLLFQKARRKELGPNVSPTIGEATKMIAKEWSRMNDEQKKRYREKAEKMFAEWKKRNPEAKYKQRKWHTHRQRHGAGDVAPIAAQAQAQAQDAAQGNMLYFRVDFDDAKPRWLAAQPSQSVNEWLGGISGSYDVAEYKGAQIDGNIKICDFLGNHARVTVRHSGN
jgi:hypothetical protein